MIYPKRLTLCAEAELRPLTVADHTRDFYSLVDSNRLELSKWLPWLATASSLNSTKRFILDLEKQAHERRGFKMGIFDKGALAGMVGHYFIDWRNRTTALGYWLGASFQGRGLATDACGAIVSHSFESLNLNRVEIRCAQENAKSCAVAERLGFTKEGVLREAEWLSDRFVDHVVYATLASEWTP